ncbi:ABC transporter substrate-binding protein [Thalassospira sp. MCCC 1A03138]|uniref:ABC transporter substrate-binding protein n=1 Tax=Thalassospira sp. MCCC 1A03138 TaxID=1470576 RepID=UPI000A1DAA56|nr:ABC transporter substrate-binding protein [Thalassospira sp. MCCC 1A03138]OSQ27660.1 taurine ABC transporter substrate-binding protein [Thalassospira sp. MCCC 1A03138]
MKHLFKGLCLSAIALGAVLGLSAPASANQELTIAHSTWVGYGPLYIARDKGFFEEEGLDVDLVVMEDVKTRMPALAAGRIDVAVTTIDTVLAFYSPEHPLSYLFALDDSRGGDGIVAGKDIKTIADLKGKSIAFTEGSVSQFFLSVLLKDAGMKLSDVNALNMSAGDAGAAFVAQKVDAAVTWEPWLTRGTDTDHGHVLVDSTKTPGLITDIMVTTNDMLEKNRPAMEGLYRAWSKAIAWQKDNVEEADEIMAKGVGGWLEDPAVFAETRAGIVFYDDAMNKTFMDPANEGGILGTIKNAKTLGEEGGLFTIDAEPASLIAADIVK